MRRLASSFSWCRPDPTCPPFPAGHPSALSNFVLTHRRPHSPPSGPALLLKRPDHGGARVDTADWPTFTLTLAASPRRLFARQGVPCGVAGDDVQRLWGRGGHRGRRTLHPHRHGGQGGGKEHPREVRLLGRRDTSRLTRATGGDLVFRSSHITGLGTCRSRAGKEERKKTELPRGVHYAHCEMRQRRAALRLI